MLTEVVSILPLIASFSLLVVAVVWHGWACGGRLLQECGPIHQDYLSAAVLLAAAAACIGLVILIYLLTLWVPRTLNAATKVVSYLLLLVAAVCALAACGLYWARADRVDHAFQLTLIGSVIVTSFLYQALISEIPG